MKQQQPTPQQKPREEAGFHFSSFVKITDPNTGKIIMQTRAD